ncbi:SusC/RagA family TonB-linked outer membrane protein [Fibrella sp. WM1]|uniref:SusC/RagA family TonB-linked outer membrane protein n=1 Tax=Fibrella musci TaxID=3242485 RepID=UPI003520833B
MASRNLSKLLLGFSLLLGTLLSSTLALAQGTTRTGRVTGQSDGAGIPGVNVTIKGTTRGAVTNANGDFTIVADNAATLVFSFIGYKSQEVAVGTQTTFTVTLADDATSLNEVVVTGYTSDSRRETSGSVSTVPAQQLKTVPSGNVEQQLQGRVAGVTVITNGQPGTSSQIRVRGFGAFGGNQPLYVVDGVPTQNINFLNPDDIESTTVLKDAAAASIYGARAANGVIVYTTRRGQRRAQKLTVTYDGLYGFTDPGKGQTILNPQEQADWTWQAKRNDLYQSGTPVGADSFTGLAGGQYGSGQTPVLPEYLLVGTRPGVTGGVDLAAERTRYNTNPANGAVYLVIPANKEGTNWYKAITRTAPLLRQTLGFSGGTDASRFYVSLGMQNQGGIVQYNDFSRYTLRANTEFDLTKNLRIGENFQLTYLSVKGQQGGSNGQNVAAEENDVLLAFRMAPIVPVYNSFGGYAGTAAPGFNNARNPVANRIGQQNNLSNSIIGYGNAYIEFDPIPALTLRSSLGGSFYNNYYNYYNRAQYENSENNTNFTYGEGASTGLAWTFTNTAQYKQRFGIHSIDLLAGIEALNTGSGRNIDGSGLNPFTVDPNYVTLSTTTAGSTRQVNSGYGRGVNFYSQFARINYVFNDKYIVTGVIRRDGSSQFGANNRYGVFPAGSVAWRLSSEPFIKNQSWITDLKVRGGYGTMGNSNNVNPNNQYNLFGSNPGNSYDLTGANTAITPGFYRSQIGNPDAKWETSITTNFGIDGSFFNNRLEIVFDLWRKDTKDLLFQLGLPGVIGVRANAPSVNIASMRNQGIDIQLIGRGNVTSDLTYEANLTGSFLQNRITALAPGTPYFTGSGQRLSTPVVRNEPGQPISSFYGYKVIGLFNSKEEVSSAPTQDGAAPGRFRFADINNDGRINDDDRTYLGSPVPKFTGGATLTLKYKNFDFVTYLYTSLGNQIFNNSKWYTDFYPSFPGAAISARVKDSWLPTNTNTTVPIFESTSNFSTNTQANSYYVENGSYLRMQNLTLGYTLPAGMLDRLGMKRVRIAVAANNLFTVTGYSGLDPAVGGAADTNFGIDIGNYPLTRSYNAVLNISF